MNISSDDTALRCVSCLAVVPGGVAANFCQGCGIQLNDSQRGVARKRSISEPAFERLARDLSGKLEKRNTIAAKRLAAAGRILERTFARWASSEPTTAQKHEAIENLSCLQRQAVDLLSGGRGR